MLAPPPTASPFTAQTDGCNAKSSGDQQAGAHVQHAITARCHTAQHDAHLPQVVKRERQPDQRVVAGLVPAPRRHRARAHRLRHRQRRGARGHLREVRAGGEGAAGAGPEAGAHARVAVAVRAGQEQLPDQSRSEPVAERISKDERT